MKRLRGLKSLVHDAVDRTAELVREGHESSSRGVLRITDMTPIAAPARTVDAVRRLGTDSVLAAIKLVNRGVEAVTDVGLDVDADNTASLGCARRRCPGDWPLLSAAVACLLAETRETRTVIIIVIIVIVI